jgi:hypothetical protein
MGESTIRDDAARRIAWSALPAAALFAGFHGLQHAVQPDLGGGFHDPVIRLLTLATVLLAAGLYALHRYRVLPDATVLTLGMVFEVALAGAISMVETSTPARPDVLLRGISGVGPWVVFVGAFVPNRPLVTLTTAMLAVSTWPLAYAINSARLGAVTAPSGAALIWPALNYLMAIVAVLVSRWTYGAARDAKVAEELGSYRLVSLLGEGGMGEVWTATHQWLARSAAIKLLRAEAIAGSSARQAEAFVKRPGLAGLPTRRSGR